MEFVTLEEAKIFFSLEDEDLDELLAFLIEHYSEVIIDKTGIDEISIKAKEALLYALGCHLSKIHVDKISPTISYTVGDVEEKFQVPAKNEISWCDLYKSKIQEILADQETSLYGLAVQRRKGLSDLSEFQ